MGKEKEHVEEIRRSKFSIGGPLNPLTEDLHQAVRNLSAELYAKDVHFLMELIQNAEDNQYFEGVDPTLDFIITSKDITATGAPATLLIFNNEKGFSSKNIESICSVGRSTKKGNRINGYIGEKGIGFKSVFLITAQPYIFSNGYQIRFNEEPCAHCGLGYIVPEWVEENPTLADIKQIYRAGDTLPTTTIVLPLKPDKVKPVKQQLSSIHPEVLLFLSKIKRLTIKEDNEDPKLNTISSVSISSEVNFVTCKNINAESYTLHLSEEENDDSEKECSYYMWRQKFPVRPENRVERRMDVDEWVITLAFPNHERLQRGKSLPGVYAFLPTEMVTNFPFIIQADFVLASSRETILLDDKWNQGILDCIPTAFVDALKSLVLSTNDAPVSSLPRMFQFLPVNSSAYEELNVVRDGIKSKLVQENIVPIETYTEQKHFYKPCQVGRLLPSFWDILTNGREEGVTLHNLSSHGTYILSSWFDKAKYDDILNFLGVKPVNNEWYAKCIQSSNLVEGVSEDVYLKLLLFVATHWGSRFHGSSMVNIPLIKYVCSDGRLSYFSLTECTQHHGQKTVLLANQNHSHLISWLIGWNKEFRCASNRYFMPESTQQAIWEFPKIQVLLEWLGNEVNISTLDVYDFANLVSNSIKSSRLLVITYAHFLYQSFSKGYLTPREVGGLCGSMPLVDSYGHVTTRRVGVVVPANVSKWADLTVSNPWRDEGYVELGKEYLQPCRCAGLYTGQNELLDFLEKHAGASDVPDIPAPDAGISGVDTPLLKENAFLLLDWIHNLKCKGISLPERFLKCIREGSWLKVTVNGYRPPSQSFLIGSELGNILQIASVLVDIAVVDRCFYGDRILEYKEELKTAGVMFSYEEACEFIGKELMSHAASFTLSKGHVLLILKFIRYLRKSLVPANKFVNSIRGGNWLKTSHGYRSPVGSVLHDSEWRTASQISDIPFIDQAYYGGDIYHYKEELQLLGVVVGFRGSYQLVIDHLKSPPYLKSLTAEAVVLMVEVIHLADDSDKLVNALKATNCLKTNNGFKTPGECFFPDPAWGCILDVFTGFPVIDHEFYGDKIFTYQEELKQTGVVVDFEPALKAFARVFKQKASQTSFKKHHVESFLSCCRRLKDSGYKLSSDLLNVLHSSKWLRTRVGDYRSPGDCILFGPTWESLSPITRLPFVDDSENCYGKGIHEYKKELKSMGVITELKLGVVFVPSCLRFPSDPSTITPENVLSLLECIQLLLQRGHSFEDDFKKGLSKHWLKTHAGFRAPDKCLLFGPKWSSFLKPMDGPFIDENFYGPKISSYSKELRAVGVVDDVEKGSSLIANHLDLHSNYSTIVQIYRCLNEYNWKPENKAKRVWIPEGDDNGEWVSPEECVNHDKDDLFGSRIHVLEKHYDKELLSFFSCAMDVRSKPSLNDYIELWKEWESSVEQLSQDKCCKFWTYVLQNRSKKSEKSLAESLMKLPATSGSDPILLSDKRDVFIADNLHLKNLFEQERVFVWYPKPSLASLRRSELLDLYKKIGVRTISESVNVEESSLVDDGKFTQVEPKNIFIGKGLIKLILGFLACSSPKMEAEKRREAVQGLLDLTVFETMEPVTVTYSLSLSNGNIIPKKANRMIRWEKVSSKFYTQKMDWSSGNASMIKYATYFSEAISAGVLSENVDHVVTLSELIKLAFLLKFNEEAVDFLMESKDLQIFWEDEEFLSSAFPVDYVRIDLNTHKKKKWMKKKREGPVQV